MANQTIHGPYRVKPHGTYEVVEMRDNTSNDFFELRPRCSYPKRESAYAKCVRLNRRWQREHQDEPDILDYWQQATN